MQVDEVLIMENGQEVPVQFVRDFDCSRCHSKLFKKEVLYSIHRVAPCDPTTRLELAKDGTPIEPVFHVSDIIVKCAGCGKIVKGERIQQQLYPELATKKKIFVPGNGTGKGE